jgi:16S rRNA G527 N7-methylase RsmG
LREALNAVGRKATIVARRFEEIEAPAVAFVSCRALDQFMEKVSTLIEWAPKGATLLLFGGEGLKNQLPEAEQFLIPETTRRYLFVVTTV